MKTIHACFKFAYLIAGQSVPGLKMAPRDPKTPQNSLERPQDGFNKSPDGPKDAPRRPQKAPRRPQNKSKQVDRNQNSVYKIKCRRQCILRYEQDLGERPEGPRDPKMAQKAPKLFQHHVDTPQDGPKRPRDDPIKPQEAPKGLKMAPTWPE